MRNEGIERVDVKPPMPQPKETEWQPKVRPGDLVFDYVAEIIKPGQQLPEDVRVMLSAWLGAADQKSRETVARVLARYGGVPKGKEMTGNFGDAVFNFVAGRIGNGTITEKELTLLTPWEDCPRGSGRKDPQRKELSVGAVVSRAMEAGRRVIAKQRVKATEPSEEKEIIIPVEYAGTSSRGGRPDRPDEDSVFCPGKLTLGEIYRQETDEGKADNLAHILTQIGIPRTKEQILAVGEEVEKLIKEGKFAGLYLVADGMGGMGAGEIASSIAIFLLAEQTVNYINKGLPINEELFEKAFYQANTAVVKFNETFNKNSGTTLVAAIIDNQGKAYIANAGDTRAYILSGGKIERITTDHSLVEELVKKGAITRKETYTHERRNVVTRDIGEKRVEPEVFERKLEDGDFLILCCDGVWEGFPPSPEQTDEQVNENLRQTVSGKKPEEMVRVLTDARVGVTSGDNTSAVVVKWR